MAYIPPHLRQQRRGTSPGVFSSSFEDQPAFAIVPSERLATTPRYNVNHGTRSPSAQDWSRRDAGSGPSTPRRSTPILASPASDLRARRAGTPLGGREVDEMDMLQSVSRSGGDGAEGDALRDLAMQERYRGHIASKLEAHYSRFGTSRLSIPAPDAASELESLGSIVLLVRKLREGVVASGRKDNFALQVFEMSAKLAIMARNTAQTISALSGLVPGLYNAVSATATDGTVEEADGLATRLSALSVHGEQPPIIARKRRVEYATLLLLHHLCHTASFETYWATLQDLTAPRTERLRQWTGSWDVTGGQEQPEETRVDNAPGSPFVSTDDVSTAIHCARYLAPHTFDPISFFHLALDTPSSSPMATRAASPASPHARAVMQWAVPAVRERAWAVMRKAYLEVRLPWAGEWLGLHQPMPPALGIEDGWGDEDPAQRTSREALAQYIERQGRKVETATGRIKLR